MYDDPQRYPDLYNVSLQPANNKQNQKDEQTLLLTCLSHETAMMDLYDRLAQIAFHPEEKRSLLEVVKNKQEHIELLNHQYIHLTNNQPHYTFEPLSFQSYGEGLIIAFNKENESYEQYERNARTIDEQDIRNTFLSIAAENKEVTSYFHNIESNNRNLRVDYGPEPFVIDIERATERNNRFRTALWTGEYLQLTLMSIQPGDDIGLEIHRNHDQFLRIEEGRGRVQMGKNRHQLNFERNVKEDDAIFVPAGTWHNITNTGRRPLKLYSIYAPPEHPHGTVFETKVNRKNEEM